MTFVLEASVALSWALPEADAAADAVLDRLVAERALVPALWQYEVANVLAQGQRLGRIDAARASAASQLLASLPIDVAPAAEIADLVASATRHDLTAYDAAYLLLAATTGTPLATLDQKLARAARDAGVTLLLA